MKPVKNIKDPDPTRFYKSAKIVPKNKLLPEFLSELEIEKFAMMSAAFNLKTEMIKVNYDIYITMSDGSVVNANGEFITEEQVMRESLE